MNNLNSSQSRSVRAVRITMAQREDAERVTSVINSAFRPVEGFFVEGDRVDLNSVLDFLSRGKFLLAESEHSLLGCVYVEPRMANKGNRGTGKGERKHLDSNRALNGRPDITLAQLQDPSSAQSEDRAYLGLLAVDPAHQQSGLGSMLMEAAEAYCRGLGLEFMDIKVVQLREELAGFYRRRGYLETGTSAFPAEVETRLPCHFIDMSKPLNEDKATR